MKGNNSIWFNQATMQAAVQCYLQTQFQPTACPTVTAVKRNGNALPAEFEIVVDSPDPAPCDGRVVVIDP